LYTLDSAGIPTCPGLQSLAPFEEPVSCAVVRQTQDPFLSWGSISEVFSPLTLQALIQGSLLLRAFLSRLPSLDSKTWHTGVFLSEDRLLLLRRSCRPLGCFSPLQNLRVVQQMRRGTGLSFSPGKIVRITTPYLFALCTPLRCLIGADPDYRVVRMREEFPQKT
jgi:hypothetical protein